MLETTIRVMCDRCPAVSEEFDGAIFTRKMARTELREKGWRRRTGGRLTNPGDECPQCSHEAPKAGA